MKPEGWYPDPSGAADTERYWDGTSWSSVMRSTAPQQTAGWTPTGTWNPAATQPITAQRMPTPGAPPPRRGGKGWFVLLGVALLATIGLVLALARPWAPAIQATPTGTTTRPATTRSASPTVPAPTGGSTATATGRATAQPTNVPLDCASGQGGWNSQEPEYSSYGLAVRPPVTMPIRLEAKQWTWLNQSALWAQDLKNPTGFALGGLRFDQGFTTLETAAAGYVKCLTSYGAFTGTTLSNEVAQATTLAGHPAFERTFIHSEGTAARLVVVDTGDRSGFGSLLIFWPKDSIAGKKIVDDLAATAKVG